MCGSSWVDSNLACSPDSAIAINPQVLPSTHNGLLPVSRKSSFWNSRPPCALLNLGLLRALLFTWLFCPSLFNWPTPPPPPALTLMTLHLRKPSWSLWIRFNSVPKSSCTFHHAHHRLIKCLTSPRGCVLLEGSDCQVLGPSTRSAHSKCSISI